MPRVLFVTKGGNAPSGGAQYAGRKWFDHLSSFVDCHLLSDFHESMCARFVKGIGPVDQIRNMVCLTKDLWGACNELHPDLVHIQSYSGYVVKPPPRVPTVITLHDEPDYRIRDTVSPLIARTYTSFTSSFEDLLRGLMLGSDVWIHAISSTIAKQLEMRGIHPEKIHVIPNGFPQVPSNDYHPGRESFFADFGIPRGARVVLTVGNLSHRKGIHRILKISEALRKRLNDVHFVIIGSAGSILEQMYVRELERERQNHCLDNVHLVGRISRSELNAFLFHGDLYLSPALSEACNLSLLEAASYGMPIVATDVGAARDLFGKDAIIVPKVPTMKQIADAVIEGLERGRCTYRQVEEFSWHNVARKLFDFYVEIMKKS